ncbi:uncharacterized protein [Amphiura filiformis]|uniref:uncharacterized protein n=1 Tax=Amphiura filiformis TaxID=82378 RepID=UPI003B222776
MVSFLSDDTGPRSDNVMRVLSHLGLAKDDQTAFSIRNSVESLPANDRQNIIKLSVIPGSFTLEAARNILNYRKRDIVLLKLDLQTLKYRSLLEGSGGEDMYQTSTKGLRYHIHMLLRSFIFELVKIAGGELAALYKEAERSYLTYYGKRLRKLSEHLQQDFVSALAKLNEDRANYVRFLGMLKTSQDLPEAFQLQTSETPGSAYLAVELIYFPQDRLKFYQLLAIAAKNRGDMLGYAYNTSYEIMQRLDLGQDADSLLQKLAEIEDIIHNQPTHDTNESMVLATCYYVRGDILSRYQRAAEAIPWLEKALDIRRAIFGGDSGNHLLIARALNSLGTAVQTKALLEPSIVQKSIAMKYFQEAYNMCRQLSSGSDKHPDIGTYAMNIGTCYHEMEIYEEAIEYYKTALRLEQDIGMYGSEKTCQMLKNIAMSYYELDRYEDAILKAKQAMEGRKEIFGRCHQLTARSVYFVGSLYLSAKNYRKARKFLDEALKIEEELWRRGMPHSSDWPRLKIRIEKLMITLDKHGADKHQAFCDYEKRFWDAENESNKGNPNMNLDRESSTSSSDISTSSEKSSDSTSAVDQSQTRKSQQMLQPPDADQAEPVHGDITNDGSEKETKLSLASTQYKDPGQFKSILERLQQIWIEQQTSESQVVQYLEENCKKLNLAFHGKTPGDGNCFFSAISDQLDLLNLPHQSPSDLRQSVVEFLRRNPSIQAQDGTIDFQVIQPDWTTYCTSMARDGEWADHIVVTATAHLLQRDILIVTSSPQGADNDDPSIRISCSTDGSKQPLLLGHVWEFHYQSLWRVVREESDSRRRSSRKRRRSPVDRLDDTDDSSSRTSGSIHEFRPTDDEGQIEQGDIFDWNNTSWCRIS